MSDDPKAAGAEVDGILAELEGMVAEHGVAVRMVAGPHPASDEGALAYTVGLSLKDQPELLCTGLPPESAHALLDQLGRRVVQQGLVLEAGQHLDAGHPDGSEGLPVAVIPVQDASDLDAVRQLYGSRSVLQVVWTDSTGRFPWHEGYANPSSLQQLRGPVDEDLLALPCPDVPPSPAAAENEELVVTTQAVLDGAAVTVVWHTADGGWQLLGGDVTDDTVPAAVHREELVEADHSLAVALTIPAGSRATREGAGQDWVQWPLGSA